jgi:hypothetical protein
MYLTCRLIASVVKGPPPQSLIFDAGAVKEGKTYFPALARSKAQDYRP